MSSASQHKSDESVGTCKNKCKIKIGGGNSSIHVIENVNKNVRKKPSKFVTCKGRLYLQFFYNF
jgi:hypothetical protein